MTRSKRDDISTKLRAARDSVRPLLANKRVHIPAHKTSTLCMTCFEVVYAFPNGLRVNADGMTHTCTTVVHDTEPPPHA